MKKFKILIIGLICLFLLVNSALANDKWWDLNYTKRFEITNNPTEFPTPILIKLPNYCNFPDCRELKLVDNQSREKPYRMIDVDKNGIPEYVFFITNLNPDILNQASKIEYSNLTPRIKYENQTLINNWKICYQTENNIICGWKDILKDPFNELRFEVFGQDLRNRFDVYTIVKFNLSSSVKYFCPLVLDLGTWPQYMITLVDKDKIGENRIYFAPFEIVNSEIHSGDIFNDTWIVNNELTITNVQHEVYGGSLILISSNKSIIITKPSIGRLNPSPEYFFKTEILPNRHILASVCTSNRKGELLPPKGPNAYVVFGEPDYDKLVRMSTDLENISDPIIHPPESIEAILIEGKDVWLLSGVTLPEIRPHIELKTEGMTIPILSFTWMTLDGQTNEPIRSNNGIFVFEQKILLNGDKWKYPFDNYEAVINIQPPYILNKNITENSF